MDVAFSKTLKDKDMDRIFAEVLCTEDLGLSKPGQLRLFHLLVRDGKFYHDDLEKWLYRNLSRYVFSRAMLEQFRKNDDLDAAIERAIQTMRENGATNEKGMGNELGEMMIYAFLEGKLSAPKLMSRVELSTDLSQYKSVCESIHLFSNTDTNGTQFSQMVFGASNIVGEIQDAVDNAFDAILRIKKHTSREIQMVEKTVLDRLFDDNEIAFLKDTIIPTPNAQSRYNTAYGVFLGYSIGVKAEEHPEIEYEELVTKKMVEDIQRHAGYIANKIKSNGLDMHSFYIYILPFMDAESDKSEIIDHVMKGAVVL
ncbi:MULTISPECIES: HamA C-terminal domain-containing protein [Caproicibacterium]|uniref:DUF1837 domain-containing protein n=1 Tax=Caproicibacterium argilliputei TaxID=3030016 RepID=A0AA97H0S0_9FIRM|nr:DUF1837 domain-containing protein [Caproicibacterium argilliputei]WOC31846.1 DUF1837 domain-containing protein [Caproicibacterium argilliputei]